MKRRAPVVEVGDGPPAALLRFRYPDWADENDPVPMPAERWPALRHIRAWRRFLAARRSWCAEGHRDYAETFHPEWSRTEI